MQRIIGLGLRCTALCLALATALPARAAPLAFVSEAAWLAAIAPLSDVTLQALPAHTALLQDSFGTWTAAQQGQPVQVGTAVFPFTNPRATAVRPLAAPATDAGQWNGAFGCASPVLGCLGATSVTYTFPFEIVGLAGQLDYRFAGPGPNLDFFDAILVSDPAVNPNPFRYQGFYGALFAPTTSITVLWSRPGDDSTRFALSDAQVLAAPIPEPAAGAMLLAAGLLLAGARMRRRAA